MSRPSAKKRNEIDSKTLIESKVGAVGIAFDDLLVAVRGNSASLTSGQVEGIGSFLRGLADRSVAALRAAHVSAKASSFDLNAIPDVDAGLIDLSWVRPVGEPIMKQAPSLPQFAPLLTPVTPVLAPASAASVPPAAPVITSIADIAKLPRPLGRVAFNEDNPDPNAGLVITGAPIRGDRSKDVLERAGNRADIDNDGFVGN